LILVAGRYEGVDERFIENDCDEEWSLGDFVISGGELAAMVVIDGITRLLPGVLGDEESAMQESHFAGLLDYPHYTRPVEIVDKCVPDVLLSGNHSKINRWRMQQAIGRTWYKRPDMLADKTLSAEQQALLDEFKKQIGIN
jgi:tRNA (guanine37-N1)-methyltransferase